MGRVIPESRQEHGGYDRDRPPRVPVPLAAKVAPRSRLVVTSGKLVAPARVADVIRQLTDYHWWPKMGPE